MSHLLAGLVQVLDMHVHLSVFILEMVVLIWSEPVSLSARLEYTLREIAVGVRMELLINGQAYCNIPHSHSTW